MHRAPDINSGKTLIETTVPRASNRSADCKDADFDGDETEEPQRKHMLFTSSLLL
jgi:hypothetical protein